ncbi:Hypothetical protein ABZS17G119_00514 [Kosakonia cowanii]
MRCLCRMALRLSGLRDRAVFMPDGAGAYPAYIIVQAGFD